MQDENKRVLIFDAVRVVAVVLVLFSHITITIGPPWSERAQPYFGIPDFYWATWGELGVTLFLVLSGLSLEYTHGGRTVRMGGFLLKRIGRIYPIYFMSLGIALAVQAAVALWGFMRYGKDWSLLSGFTGVDLVLTLTGFNAFFGKWGGTLVWSSWFIGLIMVLYLCYPGLSIGIRRYPWTALLLLFVVSSGSRVITAQTPYLSGDPLAWFPLNRVFEFGVGIFLVRVIGAELFLKANRFLHKLPLLIPLSALSFPLFLIHDPLRRLIYFGPSDQGPSLAIGIPVFLLASVLLSQAALTAHRRLMARIDGYGPYRSAVMPRLRRS